MHYKLGQRRKRFDVRPFMVLGVAGLLIGAASGMAAKPAAMPHASVATANVNSSGTATVPLAPGNKKDNVTKNSAKSVLSANSPALQPLEKRECNSGSAPRVGLEASSAPELRKLREYDLACAAPIVSRMSFFTGTPRTVAEARDDAVWVAERLKEFARFGVSPVVFMEPDNAGGLVDAKQYRAGAYDEALNAYFAALKEFGVTDVMMGTWVPWPETNIPVWSSVDPGDFAANVTKTVQIQKSYFPASKAAVLLQSMSYPKTGSWEGGAYVSLVPYVQGIPKGLIDSFGLQGFAWPPTEPGDTPQLDSKQFLRTDLAAQAARALGVKQIWMNTGTFGMSFVVRQSSPYTLSPEKRQAILKDVTAQATALQKQGFEPAIHLFAKDKGASSEGIDWSYWPIGQSTTSAHSSVFKTFAADLQAAGIPLWLYDSDGE